MATKELKTVSIDLLKEHPKNPNRHSDTQIEALAKAEYANAKSALEAVDADSRLGWLASSGYTGSRPQIEWKLRKMRELYGDALGAR